MTFAFPLPSPFWFPLQILLKIAPTYSIFLKFHFPPSKKEVGLGGGTELCVFI